MTKKFINKNKLCILLLFISTIFFIYQHLTSLNWDFFAYVLNAKYLFYHGTYFESLRVPLTPILLGIFMIFGKFGEYLYILFVSILFFYSSIKLSDFLYTNQRIKIDKNLFRFIFYFFSLSGFVLLYSFVAGTELLGLVFFELFLLAFFNNKLSGHYLALAFLTRYNFLIFAPLLFFSKNYKKILKNMGLFLIIIFPWLLFNYIKYGNWGASIIDSYVNNIYFRQNLFVPTKILDIFLVIGYALPFFISGIILFFISLRKNKFNYHNKVSLFFFVLFFFVLFDYNKIPLKDIRYLFNLLLPIAFFSGIALAFIIKKYSKLKKLIIAAMIISFLLTSSILFYSSYERRSDYYQFYNASYDIKRLNITECEILSPHWVILSYFNENVYPLGSDSIGESIRQNKIILIFKNEATIDDSFDINNPDYNKIQETNEYVFFGKQNISNINCKNKYVYDKPYVSEHCKIISGKFGSLNDTFNNMCLKFNKN